jgi:hypothetical protein
LLLTNATDEQLGNQHGFVVEQRGSRCQIVLSVAHSKFESVSIAKLIRYCAVAREVPAKERGASVCRFSQQRSARCASHGGSRCERASVVGAWRWRSKRVKMAKTRPVSV